MLLHKYRRLFDLGLCILVVRRQQLSEKSLAAFKDLLYPPDEWTSFFDHSTVLVAVRSVKLTLAAVYATLQCIHCALTLA